MSSPERSNESLVVRALTLLMIQILLVYLSSREEQIISISFLGLILRLSSRIIEIPVNSNTTCGEVIYAVKQELSLLNSVNGFGLFESCGSVDKYLEDKVSHLNCSLCFVFNMSTVIHPSLPDLHPNSADPLKSGPFSLTSVHRCGCLVQVGEVRVTWYQPRGWYVVSCLQAVRFLRSSSCESVSHRARVLV